MGFLEHLDPLLKLFWYIALPVSLFFIIQTIATFVGLDSSDGTEANFDGNLEFDHAPFQLFSLRNLINFLLGFSWSGISFYHSISSPILLLFVAILIGSLFVIMFFVVMRQFLKLGEDNTFHKNQALNMNADVYLTIPAEMSGKGKILISVRGSVRELAAMTEGEALPQGTVVKVVKIENNSLLIVERV